MMEGRRPWRLALLALAAVAVSFISISVRVHHGLIHDRMPKTSILQHHRRLSLLDPKSVETKGRTKSLRSTGNSPLQGDFELIEQSLQSYQSELAQTHENTHAQTGPAMSHMSVIQAAKDVKFGSYDLNAGLLATEAFHYTIFFFVYDSKSDTFRVWHNVPGCDHGCVRIYRVASVIAYALRKNFPARFKGPDSDDIVIMMSCGDAPRIKTPCYDKSNDYCHSSKFAPILQFGSVYIDTNILPSAIAMPMPVRPHIPCFDDWQLYRKVCQDLLPRTNAMSDRIRDGIVFGDTRRKNYWDKLIPQVLWRGTDFAYLHMKHPEMRPPNYKTDIRPFEKEAHPTDGRWAINALYGMEKQLLPRWRGVLLTSEAEIEAKEYRESGNRNVIPWCNIKFSNCYEKGEKVLAINNAKLKQLERVGISAIGDHLNMTEHAKYKYHIDLGGGGGTTWTGTIEKLALPGLLFHHVTETKDWFHDLLRPWKHYVPVKTDLSDLKQKFMWAEENPEEAQRIAESGTDFIRWMGSEEGMESMYNQFIVDPLRDIVRNYKVPPRYEGMRAIDAIRNSGHEGFHEVTWCTGRHQNSCDKS